MVHAATVIPTASGGELLIGFVMCFTEPRVQIVHHVRSGAQQKLEIDGAVSFDAAHLDAAIAALQKVRDALPKKA